jgi:hypothetical protein
MLVPEEVATAICSGSSSEWSLRQHRQNGQHRQRGCRRTCPVANWTGPLSSQTSDVHRGGRLFRARVRARGSVRRGLKGRMRFTSVRVMMSLRPCPRLDSSSRRPPLLALAAVGLNSDHDSHRGRLTVLTVFSRAVRIVIVRVPARPARPKVISMPSARRKVCARRNRPASSLGLFGQPWPSLELL